MANGILDRLLPRRRELTPDQEARYRQALMDAGVIKPLVTGSQAAYFGSQLAPGAGALDASGYMPAMPSRDQGLLDPAMSGQFNPSIRQNIREGNYGTAIMQGLGLLGDAAYAIPLAGPVVAGALKTPRAIQTTAKAARALDRAALAENYPSVGSPVLNIDKKSGKEFFAKELTDVEKQLQKERNAAQKDIQAGNYTPLFDESQRYYANPANYNLQGNTLVDAMPARADTIEKYRQRFDTPEIRQALNAAYDRGLSPDSIDWYAMGQLEDAFIAELGKVEGPKMFKERFADAMAATTGGADPTANLLMASYANFLKANDMPFPTNAYSMPHPIGGRFASGNMAMANKVLNEGNELTAAGQPKRFNFSSNFLGDTSRATIDEQMSGIYEAGLKAPPNNSYGVMEAVLGEVARERGINPANFQDVAWAGAKDYEGKPMIRTFNEMIERTSRITGESPEKVLQRFIRASGPMYAVGGLGLLGLYQGRDRDQYQGIQ